MIVSNTQPDSSIIRIQCAYRSYRARRIFEAKLNVVYIKLFDRIKRVYVYKNKKTGAIYEKKPKFFGIIDLPVPQEHRAPENYQAGEPTDNGYALIVTVNNFLSTNMEKISHTTDSDHDLIEGLLCHSFICKLKHENILTMKDPTVDSFIAMMRRLKNICRKDGFLFVYICTHVATINKGQSNGFQFNKENAYFCMRDTSWETSNGSAKSAVSVKRFCKLLNDVSCVRKVVAINYAHVPPLKGGRFRSRILYPPPDCLSRIAELANCAVIGSCNIGTPITQLVESSYYPEDELQRTTFAQLGYRLAGRKISPETDKNKVQGKGIVLSDGRGGDTPMSPVMSVSVPDANSKNEQDMSTSPRTHMSIPDDSVIRLEKKKRREKTYISEFYSDWKIEPPKILEFEKSAIPMKPQPQVVRQDNGLYSVEIPLTIKIMQYYGRLLRWGVVRSLGPPVNGYRRIAHTLAKDGNMSPRQYSLVDHEHSLFCLAIRDALKGAASVRDNEYVTALSFFATVKKAVMTRANRREPPLNQTPVIFLPHKNYHSALNPVCFRVGPPPAPNRPLVPVVGKDSVTLAWSNPPFDGVLASEYRVYMRMQTRNSMEWALVPQKGKINECKFVVRDLPFDMSVQFRVEGGNNGGWSLCSEPSVMVSPGSFLLPVPSDTKWKRVSLGGALAIIERLNQYPKHRDEFLTGLKKLIGIAQSANGFTRENIAIKAAAIAVRAIDTFFEDPHVCAMAIKVLGFSIYGAHAEIIKEYYIQENVKPKIEKLISKFRTDTALVGSVSLLRKGIPEETPPIPLVKHAPKKRNSDSDSDSEDDGDGEDAHSDWVYSAGAHSVDVHEL